MRSVVMKFGGSSVADAAAIDRVVSIVAAERGKGRVFVSIPGHFSWSFDDPLFRILLLRGIAWAGREPVDRFNELALPGARIE